MDLPLADYLSTQIYFLGARTQNHFSSQQWSRLAQVISAQGPSKTVLLAPTFIIGCSAFDPAQGSSVRSSLRTIKEYTELKDTDRALEVLEQVWRYMDQEDERSLDWQSIAHEMRMHADQRKALFVPFAIAISRSGFEALTSPLVSPHIALHVECLATVAFEGPLA